MGPGPKPGSAALLSKSLIPSRPWCYISQEGYSSRRRYTSGDLVQSVYTIVGPGSASLGAYGKSPRKGRPEFSGVGCPQAELFSPPGKPQRGFYGLSMG